MSVDPSPKFIHFYLEQSHIYITFFQLGTPVFKSSTALADFSQNVVINCINLLYCKYVEHYQST